MPLEKCRDNASNPFRLHSLHFVFTERSVQRLQSVLVIVLLNVQQVNERLVLAVICRTLSEGGYSFE